MRFARATKPARPLRLARAKKPARLMKLATLARGALTAALALVAVTAAPAPAEAAFEPPLPALNITDTYVTGISSGGFMASQLQIANSATFKGAAVFAAGPYYCGQGSILHGLAECTGLTSTDPAGIVATARRWSEQGKIDPVANLAGKPVYTYHGTKDPLVSERVSDEGVEVHRQLGARIAYHDTDPAGHGWPRPDGALPCGTTFYPFLIDCGNDPQGELLTHWLGSVRPPAAAQTGTLSEHDQDRYTPGGWAQFYSLGSKSFLYTPDSCAAGKPCKLVVALHGCLSDNKFVGDRFARESYLNEYADTNDLVILYPQTDISVARGNPQGCWDWWGYTGSDYAQKSAPQMRMIMNEVRALGGAR